MLAGPATAQTSTVRGVDCGEGVVFDPQILLQSQPVLQTCFLITTADSFGNMITASDDQLNLAARMSVQLDMDVRQQQDQDGEHFQV